MHGGLSQCTHGTGIIRMDTRGYSPSVTGSNLIHERARERFASSGATHGTVFSDWQATVHAWQPLHFARSITIPQRDIGSPLPISDRQSSNCGLQIADCVLEI